MYILFICIIIIILLKYSKKELETFCDNCNVNISQKMDHIPITNNTHPLKYGLKSINEYNRNNIPIYLKQQIFNDLKIHVLNKFKNILVPIDIDFIKITHYPGIQNFYLEIFILDNTNYTTTKFIVDYDVMNGGKFSMNDMRVYSFKQTYSNTYTNIHGLDKDHVISKANLSNPFIDNSLNPGINNSSKTSLEYHNLSNEFALLSSKNPINKKIKQYNVCILPEHISDTNLYMTMTPDFFNNNVYPVEINNDIFSRTRVIPSFPHSN